MSSTACAILVAGLENRIVVTFFASNVARMQTVMEIAAEQGRRVALVGRGMNKIYQAARESGYLDGNWKLISPKEVGYLPRDEVLLCCTGSQGEPRAALWRIARDDHPDVVLDEGDAVIFSSRVIPGNDVSIFELENHLVRRGIKLFADGGHYLTHVSGHPARDELSQMYQWVRPQVAIPVHGEPRHLVEHAEFARSCQVPQALVAENGTLIRLAEGRGEIVDHVPTGRFALDGTRLVRAESNVIRGRRKLAFNGSLAVSLVVDGQGVPLAPPQVAAVGVIEDEGEDAVLGRGRGSGRGGHRPPAQGGAGATTPACRRRCGSRCGAACPRRSGKNRSPPCRWCACRRRQTRPSSKINRPLGKQSGEQP